MNRYKLILVIALSLLLIGHAAALYDTDLEWTVTDEDGSADGWLVSGDGGSFNIRVVLQKGSLNETIDPVFETSAPGTFKWLTTAPTEMSVTFTPEGTAKAYAPISVTFTGTDEYSNPGTWKFNSSLASNPEYIKIDHNDPVGYVSVNYDDPVTVTQLGDITIKMQDEYGNLVDNRYENDKGSAAESVTFWCTPGSDFGFWDGSAIQNPSYTVPVDSDGIVSVEYKVSKYAGANPITAVPSCFNSPYSFTITSIGESVPHSMTTEVAPSTKEVRADGVEKFYFKYTVYDQYGNPSPYTPLTITTNIGWSTTLETDILGVARMSLGPADQIATVDVTVTSPADPGGFTSTTTVHFVDVGAAYISLSANPAQLPSKDVNDNYRSEILAILTDPNGNPSKDQQVTFWFEDVNTTEPHVEGGDPYIYDPDDPDNHIGVDAPITLTTNWNGEASVYFVPGRFNAIPVATGRCIIIADWNGTQRAIEMVWRNEPYLTVETSVESPNSTLAPCDEIDVEILLKGDGLINVVNVPVDVMFCIARTERMFDDTYWTGSSGDAEDKIVYAMDLTKNFTLSIEEGLSRFGLVTYGKNGDVTTSPSTPTNIIGNDSDNPPDDMNYITEHYPGYDYYGIPRVYSDYATLDQPLDGEPYNDTRDAIDLIMPSTDPNPLLKPDRAGIYLSIKELAETSPEPGTNPVRAVVVMTDNRKWTIYGDPLAGGVLKKGVWSPEINDKWSTDLNDTSRWWKLPEFDATDNRQNLAFYANDNDIMIFAIALRYHDTNVDNDLKTAYTTLAEQTGGEYYEASCGEDILTALTDIGEKIKRTAAINASLTLEFVGAPENETGFDYTAGEVFDYIYYGSPTNESTVIQHWNWTGHPDHTEEIGSGDIVIRDECIDQTGEYESNHLLSFDVGTINIKETWRTKFRLKVNCTLNDTFCFNLYGNGTKLVGTGEDGSEIPIEFPDQYLCVMGNTTVPPNSTTNFTHGPLSFSEDSQYILNVTWPVHYEGEFNVTEYVYINEEGKQKGSPETIVVDNTTAICWQRIDLRQFPRATGIQVTVHPSVYVADLQDVYPLGVTGDNYIRIE